VPGAAPGMMTGFILAMARGAGEVAPLMLVGVVKLAPTLPLDGLAPFIHLERKFMHLGFHIYDLGFQSPDSEAAKPMVFATTLFFCTFGGPVSNLHAQTSPTSTLLSEAYFTLFGEWLAEAWEDLDYLSSKGIDLEIKAFSDYARAYYRARWGYRGAGDRSQPFKGFVAHAAAPVSFGDGVVVVDLTRSKKLRNTSFLNHLDQFIHVQPTDEFKLKLFQLILCLGKQEINHHRFREELDILLERLSITPNCDGVYVGSWRLAGTKDHPGYLNALLTIPEQTFYETCTWVRSLVRSFAPLFGITGFFGDPTALRTFITNIDYATDQEIVLHNEGTELATIHFGYHGIGNEVAPLSGCLVRLQLPVAPTINTVINHVEKPSIPLDLPSELVLPLSAGYECMIKLGMILASVHNGSLAAHLVPEEIEKLVHRLTITPGSSRMHINLLGTKVKLVGSEKKPGLLRVLSSYAHTIMRHDFAQHEMTPLDNHEAMMLLFSVAYRSMVEYADVRENVRTKLSTQPEGAKLLANIADALSVHRTAPTMKTKKILLDAMSSYRTLELTTGKESFQKIVDFVVKEIALIARRSQHLNLVGEQIKQFPLVQEFEDHGINVDLSLFWQTYSSSIFTNEEFATT